MDDKVREIRLRRAAERQGLRLTKSRRRDARALDYGKYALVDISTDAYVLGAPITRGMAASAELDDVENYLYGRGDWKDRRS